MPNSKLKRVARIGLLTAIHSLRIIESSIDKKTAVIFSGILVKEEYLERMNKTHAELQDKVFSNHWFITYKLIF